MTAGRYHLEFVVPVDEAGVLAARLAAAGLPAGDRVRRGRGVVTWKGGETIGTFLRWIGAGPSLLELESRQVSRAFRGDLNRLLNAESANLDRIAMAAARQVAAIATLEADGRLADQPESVRAVAALRRRTPEASLAELAAELATAARPRPASAGQDRVAWRSIRPAACRTAGRGRMARRRATAGPVVGRWGGGMMAACET